MRSASLLVQCGLMVALLAPAALGACGPNQTGPGARGPGVGRLAPCPAPAQGLDRVIEPGSVVVFGEVHGTNEVPAFVASAACEAAQRSPVVVGLEMPAALTPALRAYLASEGTQADREALLKYDFWDVQDGRASKAMLALVEELRRLTQDGRSVDVFGFDVDQTVAAQVADRDRRMARNIASALAAPSDPSRVVMILTGNYHARTDEERWMAWHLKQSFPQMIALNVEFHEGTAWVCMADGCGPRPMTRGPNQGARAFVERKPDRDGQYDGRYYLGNLTASSPLRPAAVADSGANAPADARSRGLKAYGDKDYTTCVAALTEAAGSSPAARATNDYYNAACCAALAGDTDTAFARLGSAIEGGYRDVAHMQKDADLASLRADPRWKEAVAAAEAKQQEYVAANNAELIRIRDADQADRQGGPGNIDWSEVSKRDAQRLQRVRQIIAEGGATTSVDYYNAALVFQHSNETADYQTAHELAVKAAELDPDNGAAKWLAAAAKDRHLMSQGKPQLYGTQFKKIDGRWQLWEVDPNVTDQERARWNVPPLAAARQRAEAMNRAQ